MFKLPIFDRVGNGDGVTGDGGDGEVTGDKIVTGEAFSPVKLVLKRDRYAQKSGFFSAGGWNSSYLLPEPVFLPKNPLF